MSDPTPAIVRRLRLGPRLLLLYAAPTLAMVLLVTLLAVPVVSEWRSIGGFEQQVVDVEDRLLGLELVSEERVQSVSYRFGDHTGLDEATLERAEARVDALLERLDAPSRVVDGLRGPRGATQVGVAVPVRAWSDAADWLLDEIDDALAAAPTDELQRRADTVAGLAAMIEYADRESIVVYVPFADGETQASPELAGVAGAIHERELVLARQVETDADADLLGRLRTASFGRAWSSVVGQRNDLRAGQQLDADRWFADSRARVSLLMEVLDAEIAHLRDELRMARTAQGLQGLVALIGAGLAAVLIGASFVFLRRSLLAPIASMTQVARDLALGEVAVHESTGDDELAELEGQFSEVNRVLDELDRESQRVTTAVARGDHGARFEIRHDGAWGRLVDGLNDSLDRMSGAIDHALASDERRRDAESTARHLRTHDALTGLLNRTGLTEAVRARHDPSRWDRRWAVAVVPENLDMIDRADGKGTSAEVIAALGARIAAAAGDRRLVGHLNDREFVVIGADDELNELLAVLARALADPVRARGTTYATSCATGHATNRATLDGLITAASTAATVALHEGITDPIAFHPSMQVRAQNSIELQRWLSSALEHEELEVWYQPILHIQSSNVVGHEALVRGRRIGELVTPDVFIPLAESTGVIDRIDRFVLDRATRDRQQLGSGDGTIAVNISPAELERDDLVAAISTTLDRHSTPPGLLTIEVTESSLVSERPDVTARLHALRELGVKLAIDDFGAGYSSLGYLRNLPFNVVKLDRSIVAGLDHDESAASVVHRTIELAHDLDMIVVAEGVERVGELNRLQALGCDCAQGWLIGRPAPLAHELAL